MIGEPQRDCTDEAGRALARGAFMLAHNHELRPTAVDLREYRPDRFSADQVCVHPAFWCRSNVECLGDGILGGSASFFSTCLDDRLNDTPRAQALDVGVKSWRWSMCQ